MAKKDRTISVPFESIDVDYDFNPRTDYENIEELKDSILEHGLLQSLGVTPKTNKTGNDDEYYLIYGYRRYQALQKIRELFGPDAYAKVEVHVNHGTLEELRDRNARENLDRKELKPHEVANLIRKMSNSGLSQRDIAARLGRPQSWVSNYHKIATSLVSDGIKALESGNLTVEQALDISSVPEEDQASVIDSVLNADTRVDARKAVKEAAKEKGQKRTYTNKGRITAKNIYQYVRDASFEEKNAGLSQAEKSFYNGLAAGLRVAVSDVDFDSLSPNATYSDVNFKAEDKKDKAKPNQDSARKTKPKAKSKVKAGGKKSKSTSPTKSSKENPVLP